MPVSDEEYNRLVTRVEQLETIIRRWVQEEQRSEEEQRRSLQAQTAAQAYQAQATLQWENQRRLVEQYQINQRAQSAQPPPMGQSWWTRSDPEWMPPPKPTPVNPVEKKESKWKKWRRKIVLK